MDQQLLPVSEAGEIRNIGVLAHVDAGKTSITERILYLAGLRREAGTVDEGTTATDYLSVERRHGITVKSAAVRFEWNGCTVHLIDTPGHVDFGNEVDRALRILDGAVIALCSVSGVQARTEVIARACAERSLPRLYFINKMDRSGADFFGIVEELRAGLELNAVALQYPLYEGQKWVGMVDLLQMKALRFDSAESPSGDLLPLSSLSAEVQSKAGSARALLVEKIAEVNEEILALYASDQEIPAGKLGLALGQATKAGKLVPVLCGSAFVDASVKLLLDAVTALLPSPAEAGIPEGIDLRTNMAVNLLPSRDAPLAAFVFKTLSDEAGDVFAWTRIWSGTMKAGKKIFDARSEKDVMVRKIFGIHADSLVEMKEAGAGEVVALKMPGVEPGASLCERSHPVVFEALAILEPVVSQVVEPATLQELTGVRHALEVLAVEDSSLRVREERETGRFEVAGQGELHLDIVAERLWRDFGLRVRVGNPRVNCRERLKRGAKVREDFDHDFGGERVRVSIEILAEPLPENSESEIATADGLRIAPQFLAAARRGIESAIGVGPGRGWPMEAIKATVLGLLPPGSGSGKNGETAVEAAAALAVRKALLQAGSDILEPVMYVDIECPEEFFGSMLNAVSSRGGRIESVEDRSGIKNILARAPMRNLFGFAGEIRAMSRGRAQFQARFGCYEPLRQPFEP